MAVQQPVEPSTDIQPDQVVLDSAPAGAPVAPAQPSSAAAPSPEIQPDKVVLDADRYGTTGQAALAHLEAAGRGLAGPLATAAERALGVPAEDIKKREEANPETKATELTTFGVSALTGIGEAGLVAKAGTRVETAVLGEAAAQAAEAASIANRATRAALRTGVETALLQSGDEVNRMILGDPGSAADVALAGGIGMLAGGALGSVPGLWKVAHEKTVGRWLRSAGDAVTAADKAPASFGEEVAKKVGKAVFGVPEAATEGYMKNVEGVQKASGDLWDVAEKLPKAVSELGTKGGEISKEARAALLTDRTIPLSQIREMLSEVPSKKATAELGRLAEEANARSGDLSVTFGADNISQKEVRGIMDELRKDVNFNAPLPTAEKGAVRSAYGQLNDILKTSNETYASEIGHSAAHLSLRASLVRKLRLVKDYTSEYGFKPTDTTVSRLKDLARADKKDVADILNSLKKLGHDDLAEEVKNTLIKQAFEKDATRGSRLVVAGGATGAAIGHMTGLPGGAVAGGALGSWLGAAADRYGSKAYYDVLGKLAKKAPPQLGTARLKGMHAALPMAKSVLADEHSASGAKAAVDYTAAVVKGTNQVKDGIRVILERGGQHLLHLEPSEHEIEAVKREAEALRNTPEKFVDQGSDLASHMPENATALAASKARALSYLQTLKPEAQHGLPFDEPFVSKDAERRYTRAAEVAASPLVVLRHIQKGTLEPDQVKDLNSMFPALGQALRAQVFAGAVDMKHADKMPTYQARQGLSLLAGEPLDSTFTPVSIAAAQATFLQRAAQQAPQQKKLTKTKSHLSKLSGAYATSDQAAAARTKGGSV